jgi:diguanylate cyclase (GGDEF)-like protein/PAS domain S-box-containing protein
MFLTGPSADTDRVTSFLSSPGCSGVPAGSVPEQPRAALAGSRLERLVEAQQQVACAPAVPETVMAVLAAAAQEVCAADGAVVVRNAGDHLVLLAGAGSLRGTSGICLDTEASLLGWVASTGESAYSADVRDDPRVDQAVCRKLGVVSGAVVPLMHEGEMTAVVAVTSRQPGALGLADVAALERLAAVAAARLEAADALAALGSSEERFRLALDQAPIGIALVGLDGHWLRVNDAMLNLVGRTREELLAVTFQDITHPDDLAADLANVADVLAGRCDNYRMDKRYVHADGRPIWVRLTSGLVRSPDGRPLHLVAHVEDITGHRAQQQDLERQARTDTLTGLLNRRGWEQSLITHLDRALAAGESLAVAVLDLDHFKVFNDTFGHPAGDVLLAEVAAAWASKIPSGATLARLGGEEFGLALPATEANDARDIVTALTAGIPRGQTVSGGVTTWLPGEDAAELLARADGALYTAKRNGRNHVVAVVPA